MPSYNRAAYIKAAIESILAQSYGNWELLFLDDASTDETGNIVDAIAKKNPRIRYMRQSKNIGSTRTRNAGIEQARGKYIAILDSDDVWLDPKKLDRQIVFLEQNPGYGIIGTAATKIDNNENKIGNIVYDTDDATIRKHILRRHQFVHSSVVFLKQAAVQVGNYNTAYGIADDFDFILAIGKKYSLANLPEVTTAYRVHDGSLTQTKRAQLVREHLAIIKKYRHDYPGFWPALVKSYLRIFLG
jgi:glycosyltransferase involved in cell wall biosynthesis